MRVWIVNQYAAPLSAPGPTRHFTLGQELVRRGHEVLIIATSFNHHVHKETRLAPGQVWKHEVIEDVPFLWLRTPQYGRNGAARLWNMAVFSGRVWAGTGLQGLGKPDVLIGSSPHLFGALAAERLARRLRVPFVLEVRDIWPQSLIDLGGISPRHPLMRLLDWIERYLYRRSARIIALLPGAVEHIARRGAQSGKVVWIPNGVDLNRVPPPAPPAAHDRLVAIYAGAHGLANGLDTVLDAATILQQEGWSDRLQFRFVGDGPDKEHLARRIESERIMNVLLCPPVPKSEIYPLLQAADVCLMVLRDSPVFKWGVSPNKLFDYLAAARPVVFGVNTPFNPVAEADAGLTAPPGDARAIAGAVRRLAELSPAARWQMGLRGRRYIEEHHDSAQLAAKLESVLGEVLAKDGIAGQGTDRERAE